MPNARAKARARDPRAGNGALMSALTTFLDRFADDVRDSATRADDPNKGPRHPYIVLVNTRAERIRRAFRAAVREQVRQLPGRAQKGAVDSALHSVTPKIAKVLR